MLQLATVDGDDGTDRQSVRYLSVVKHPHGMLAKWIMMIFIAAMALGAFLCSLLLLISEKKNGTLLLKKADALVADGEALAAVLLAMNAKLDAVTNATVALLGGN